MRTTLILTHRDVARLLEMPTAIRVVRECFKAQARGETTMPPKLYLPLPHQSDFRVMPAALRHPACCGVKWVNVHPRNPAKGLPTVMAVIVLNDPQTGFPVAVMDGLLVTRVRTGAAAGVAAKALARPESRIAALIGCGAQAPEQLLALRHLFRLAEIRVWGRRPEEAARFCRRMRRALGVPLRPAATVKQCVEGADLITTITPSRRPLIRREWVKPGAHINAVGADAPGKQELDPRILRQALVVVDERRQAIHGGEINVPVSRGLFRPSRIHATLGDVLLGRASGRRHPADVTVFDSTGLAIHDVALGYALVRQALRRRLGRAIRLVI